MKSLAFAIFFSLVAVACFAGEPEPLPTLAPLPALTFAPAAEATVEPTAGPTPKATPVPVPTVEPTAKLRPTRVPLQAPTLTPARNAPTRSPVQTQFFVLGVLEATSHAIRQVRSGHYDAEIASSLIDPETGELVKVSAFVSGVFEVPDRERMEVSLSVGETDLETGMIIVGDESWVRDRETQVWLESDEEDFLLLGSLMDLISMGVDLGDLAVPVLVGEILLDGREVYHVSIRVGLDVLGQVVVGVGSGDGEGRLDYWIGVSDKLVWKVRVQFFGDGPAGSGEHIETLIGVRLREYGKEVDIRAPEGEENG